MISLIIVNVLKYLNILIIVGENGMGFRDWHWPKNPAEGMAFVG